jgi:hypothetical protein
MFHDVSSGYQLLTSPSKILLLCICCLLENAELVGELMN